MSVWNYIRGKRGMSLKAEVMEQPQVYSFLHSSDGEIFSELSDKINKLVIMMRDLSKKTRKYQLPMEYVHEYTWQIWRSIQHIQDKWFYIE